MEYCYYLASIIGSGVSVFLLYFTYRQLRKLSLQINASTLFEVDKIMHGLRPKWHEIYRLKDKKYTDWTSGEKKVADEVCTELQRVAYLAEKGFIDKSIILDQYATVFARTWVCLKDYIKAYREYCGEPREIKDGGYQRNNYEKIAKESQEYCKKKGISIFPNPYK